MKKYYPVDISFLFTHKMMCDANKEEKIASNDIGVSGAVVCDKRFDDETCMRYIKGIKYALFGQKSNYDNFTCNEQIIELPRGDFKKIAILGFNEYGRYFDDYQFVDSEGGIVTKPVLFYQLAENIDALYDCEISKDCQIAFVAKSNSFVRLQYYYNVIDIPNGVTKLILPCNNETHIAAITLIE